MGFFDSIGNFFEGFKGLLGTGERGGRRDAFTDFMKFGDELRGDYTQALSNILGHQQFGFQNPLLQDDITGRLGGVRDMIAGQRGALDTLPQQLTRSALARTAGPQVAALQAARMSGGGRSGLAFSGGASALARRAAQEAAVGSSAALADALVQGNVARANYLQQNTAQQLGLEDLLTRGLSAQSGVVEGRLAQIIAAELARAGARTDLGVAALGGGLQGAQGAANRRTSLVNNLIGAAGQAAAGTNSIF